MSEIIERTFPVASLAHLDLSNIRGNVEIRPGEDGAIHVTAAKDPHSGDPQRTEIELSQDPDGTVKVATHFPDAAWSWLIGSFPCRVDYVVHTPRKCSVKVDVVSSKIFTEGLEGEFSFHSVSGAITLRDLGGPMKVKTVSGEMELVGLTGDLQLNTVSGQVSGRQILGPVHLDTVSGKIALEESSLPSVIASTVSGRMIYQTAFGEGPYRFSSVSGDVELLIPPETQCSAELHAISGKLSSKLPATSTSLQKGHQTMQIQGGGVGITLNSVSGNLSLAF
jgi:DUF4097 and DUF4098 domain-containing protein YvlB